MALLFFCGAPIILPLLLVFTVHAFKWGVYALQEARYAQGTTGWTWRFLALHLCEPLPNGIVIGSLFVNLILSNSNPPLLQLLAITAPMAILTAPLVGIMFDNPDDRAISLQLFQRGVLRWVCTCCILATTTAGMVGVDALFFSGGCYLLWNSIRFADHLIIDHTYRRLNDERAAKPGTAHQIR